MLYVTFGRSDNTITYISDFFDDYFTPEWLAHPLVKEMILDIDNTEVKHDHWLESSIFGQVL